MSGVILALVEHPETAPRTLAAARHLAGLMGSARINVLGAAFEATLAELFIYHQPPIPIAMMMTT